MKTDEVSMHLFNERPRFQKNENQVIETFLLQIRIQHLHFRDEGKFYASGHYDINFIGVKRLRVYKGFDREESLWVKFYTSGHFLRSNLL